MFSRDEFTQQAHEALRRNEVLGHRYDCRVSSFEGSPLKDLTNRFPVALESFSRAFGGMLLELVDRTDDVSVHDIYFETLAEVCSKSALIRKAARLASVSDADDFYWLATCGDGEDRIIIEMSPTASKCLVSFIPFEEHRFDRRVTLSTSLQEFLSKIVDSLRHSDRGLFFWDASGLPN